MDQFDICMIHKMGTEIKGSGPIDGVNYKMDYSESKGTMEFDGWCIRIENTPCNYGGQRPWFRFNMSVLRKTQEEAYLGESRAYLSKLPELWILLFEQDENGLSLLLHDGKKNLFTVRP